MSTISKDFHHVRKDNTSMIKSRVPRIFGFPRLREEREMSIHVHSSGVLPNYQGQSSWELRFFQDL